MAIHTRLVRPYTLFHIAQTPKPNRQRLQKSLSPQHPRTLGGSHNLLLSSHLLTHREILVLTQTRHGLTPTYKHAFLRACSPTEHQLGALHLSTHNGAVGTASNSHRGTRRTNSQGEPPQQIDGEALVNNHRATSGG